MTVIVATTTITSTFLQLRMHNCDNRASLNTEWKSCKNGVHMRFEITTWRKRYFKRHRQRFIISSHV